MSTKIQIMANTNYAIAEVIKGELLESAKVNIAVAFLRKSGIDQIFKALDCALTKNNAKVEIEAIYNEIKFTDSVFIPTRDYLGKYASIKKYIDKSGKELDSSIKQTIEELKKEEEKLPGPGPTLKKIIIEIIKNKQNAGVQSVPLSFIYEESEKIVDEQKLKFKMDTFRNSIRSELNKHEQNSKHPDNMSLFTRLSTRHYSLTDKGKSYEGR
jgi:hypothetical protein